MPDLINSGLALFFAWLLATAGLHKLRAQDYYLDLLAQYFPTLPLRRLMLLPLASVELLLALLLLLPQTQAIGLLGGAALLSVYAAVMVWQIKRGLDDIACGCAGPASTLTVSPALVARNLLCAALAVFALANPVTVAAGLAGYGVSAFVAAFMIILYLCSDQLIANAQQMAGEK